MSASSQPWSSAATMTKVAGTDVTALDFSTTGSKTGVLSSPVTLSTGRYYLAYVVYGSVSAPFCEGMRLGDQGFLGTASDQGNNSTYEYFTVDTGRTSLPSTLATNSASQGSNPTFPVTILAPLA